MLHRSLIPQETEKTWSWLLKEDNCVLELVRKIQNEGVLFKETIC